MMEVSKYQLKWEMMMRISDLYLKDVMSDVTFLVDEPPHRCPCHKLVLGLGSQVFKAMLYGKMAEKGEIRVPDVSKAGFTILLQYLYTGKCSIQNQSEALEAAYASKKYLIKDLFKACESYLLTNSTITPETVFTLYDEASFLELKRLQRHCLRYVSRNSKNILKSRSFLTASKGAFEAMLQLDVMDIESETEIIEAVWLWGKDQGKASGIGDSIEDVKKKTVECLKHVRFLCMRKDEVEKVLEKFPILDTAEHLSVMWTMSMPKVRGSANLPSNICDINRTRSISNSSRIELPTEYRYDGNLSSFTTNDHTVRATLSIRGPRRVTLLGFVVALRPIPCYSPAHRTLDFEIRSSTTTRNGSSAAQQRTSAKSFHRIGEEEEDEAEEVVLLDDFVELSEGEEAVLEARTAAEGVRLMQCVRSEFSCRLGEATSLTVRFDSEAGQKIVFPVKEIMCVEIR